MIQRVLIQLYFVINISPYIIIFRRITLGGMLVDIGAQWVHGQINNTVYELASPLGVLEVPEEIEGTIFETYNSEGHMIPQSITENFFNLFMAIEDASSEGTRGRNDSVGDFFIDM